VHLLLDSKVSWVDVPKTGKHYQRFPPLGIEEWHKKNGVYLGSDNEAEEEVEAQKPAKRQKRTPKKK
jgi:hypothetical protein